MNQTQTSGRAPVRPPEGLDAVEITGLTADSRSVRPGYLFAALAGAKTSGTAFIGEAQRRGAVAVLAPAGTSLGADASRMTLIEDVLPRRRFALMAAAFHGGQPEFTAAVTGTSGKSSTVSFARQIWQALGLSAASLGTLGVESPVLTRYSGLTTADPVALHADLAALARGGVTRAAMEASSHGLDQFRLDGVRVRAAGFTSFGRDHLDYHPDTEAYFAAKLRLFTKVLAVGGVAVLNADIPEFARLKDATESSGHRVLSYGRQGLDFRIESQVATPRGQSVRLLVQDRIFDFELPLVGAFQLMNALCALGLVAASEIAQLSAIAHDPKFVAMIAGFESLQGVRGRLEHVATLPNGASVYVDYAHKPDALVAVLEALRPHATGRLILAFGCGGDRDPGKRPLMGAIAARLADRVIVTDDNPRSEDPAAVRAAILAESPGAIEIGDRAEAIEAGIRALGPGDVLVIAGKGHEEGQIVGDIVLPFDDAAVARDVVKALAS